MTDLLTRRAPAATSSLDAEAREIDAVLATESAVRRSSWQSGPYDEILSVAPQAVDTSRMDAMPFLDSHAAYAGLDARLGTVVPGSLRFEGKTAIVRVRLSRTEAGDRVLRDLQDGHRLAVSVGYKIVTTERTEPAQAGGVPVIRATKWQPMELSLVSVPADAAATTRAHENEGNQHMPQQQTQTNDKQSNLTRAERQRIGSIHALARSAKIDVADELVTRAVDEGTTLEAFRSAMLDHLIAQEERSPTFPHAEVRGMGDSYNDQITARQDALVARMTGQKPSDNARYFMGASLIDHARGLLEAQGVDTRSLSREEVLGYRRSYHTTSDFPLLLQGAGQRVLHDAYTLAQSPLKTLISRQSTAADFRAKSRLKVSDAGLLEKVSETGEIKSTTRSETSESYKIESYGRIFSLSFQAIVNDDLAAFADWSTQAGRMAALTENKVLLDILLAGSGAGPLMGEDGKRLFHADHGNLAAAGTALDETSLAAAVLALRTQKAFGGQRLAAAPKFILTGPELEFAAQKVVTTINPTRTADAVPDTVKNLTPVVEPSLDGRGWYIFSDPAVVPTFEWSYLAGHEGPQIDSRDGFERLGTEFRAVLHFGGGAIDWRGAYRNGGL